MDRLKFDFIKLVKRIGTDNAYSYLNEYVKEDSLTVDSLPQGVKERVKALLPSDNGSNVIHAPFGSSKKGTRGRIPSPNGYTDLARKFLQRVPNGPTRDFIAYAQGINPSLKYGQLQSTFWKLKNPKAA